MRSVPLVVAFMSMGSVGCGVVALPHVAHLAGVHVIEIRSGEAAVGIAEKPSGADPVTLNAKRPVFVADCHTREEIDAVYGRYCEGFKPTAKGGAGASGTPGVSVSTPGLHPPGKQEAWYCNGDWVIRLALVTCAAAGPSEGTKFRVDQVVLGRATEAVQ
ncbi:MAG TPA: hypothetical protein VF395_02095 [Polyangiaceae bacterium]